MSCMLFFVQMLRLIEKKPEGLEREEYALGFDEKERLALLRVDESCNHVFSYAPFLEVSLTLAFPSILHTHT
jgi:hypothetical protein